uniref:MADS-box domain-containing protein n=1 Tax=Oryza glumipatula TaxID=40148 RepID=A0A0D9Z9R6_9ORYZ
MFKKRQKSLMKKASELSTLYGVDACVVMYAEGEAQPMMKDQYENTTNLEGFLKQRIANLQEKVDKAKHENDELETKLLLLNSLDGCLPSLVGLTVKQITSLNSMVEERLKKLRGNGLLATPVPTSNQDVASATNIQD